MAANPEDLQRIDTYPGIKLPRNLDSVRRIRMATAQVLRAMGERKVSVYTGKALVFGLGHLHEMVINERAAETAPKNTGTTVNIALVAGEVSPGVRLVRELASARDLRRIEGVVQDGPLCPDDIGVEPA